MTGVESKKRLSERPFFMLFLGIVRAAVFAPLFAPAQRFEAKALGSISSSYDNQSYAAAASGLARQNAERAYYNSLFISGLGFFLFILVPERDFLELPVIGLLIRRTPRFAGPVFAIIYLMLIVSYNLMSASYDHAVAIEAVYNRRMLSLSGLTTLDEMNKLQRDWAAVKDKGGYEVLHKEMQAIADKAHVHLPDYTPP